MTKSFKINNIAENLAGFFDLMVNSVECHAENVDFLPFATIQKYNKNNNLLENLAIWQGKMPYGKARAFVVSFGGWRFGRHPNDHHAPRQPGK